MCALCEKNKDDIEQDVTALNNTYEEALDFLDRDEQSVRCPALRAAVEHIIDIYRQDVMEYFIRSDVRGMVQSERIAFSLAFLWGFYYRNSRAVLMNWTDADIASLESDHLMEELTKILTENEDGN